MAANDTCDPDVLGQSGVRVMDSGIHQEVGLRCIHTSSGLTSEYYLLHLHTRSPARRMFTIRCENIVAAAARRAVPSALDAQVESPKSWRIRMASLFRRGTRLHPIDEKVGQEDLNAPTNAAPPKERKSGASETRRLRPDMIRRMDDAPKLVNPSGWISESPSKFVDVEGQEPPREQTRQLAFADESMPSNPDRSTSTDSSSEEASDGSERVGRPAHRRSRRLSDPGKAAPHPAGNHMQRFETFNMTHGHPLVEGSETFPVPRTQTIEFAPPPRRSRPRSVDPSRPEHGSILPDMAHRRPTIETIDSEPHRPGGTRRSSSIGRTGTTHTHQSTPNRRNELDFGGFPWPPEIVSNIITFFFPSLKRRLNRTVTMPRTMTVTSHRPGVPSAVTKVVPYISFSAIVGRNSVFHALTNEQLEELGGVEYRALTALLWIVAGYHILIQMLAFTVIGPYMSIPRWKPALSPPAEHRPRISRFAFFQVVSAYTNAGMSLSDQSMIPFQSAYPMIIIMGILILAGNTAFPIFLRLSIWIISKLFPRNSRINETLHFLLDHPRRCFIYLFPSHQTWFLLTILVILKYVHDNIGSDLGTDWFFFLVLDIGNSAIDSIPIGMRFIDGLLQALAVRSAGFIIVSLSTVAPALKVLYVIMMYISVSLFMTKHKLPSYVSVRSTNVYEERSLGIYPEDEESDAEDDFSTSGARITVWSRYLTMHARKQLAFGNDLRRVSIENKPDFFTKDMWWLALALFLVCIIERDRLMNPENSGWFNIFSILFELVSAYGTVGLSLGVPYANYSFSGAFRPLSKLIVCAVMLRGRHRGLPVAIDRAVLLPVEYSQNEDGEPRSPAPSHRRRASLVSVPTIATGHNVGSGSIHDAAEHRHRPSHLVQTSTERANGRVP
ncbi:hypothetical protein EW146_g6584 [Bondarzewia mesenterica]|uniref:Potassium transport protein n=1 Tax=Bondarzewia mesenterica TaxID=1095465 RepID=A0A4S4LQ06_9AGAM|nr:hypothetical protein EW146_g6584 [Bondarzewia mesenterica]